jgi:hypothetical protein
MDRLVFSIWGVMTRKRVVVSEAAVKRAARENTKASFKLSDREVPEDFVRSPAVERYIRERASNPWPDRSKDVEGQEGRAT